MKKEITTLIVVLCMTAIKLWSDKPTAVGFLCKEKEIEKPA